MWGGGQLCANGRTKTWNQQTSEFQLVAGLVSFKLGLYGVGCAYVGLDVGSFSNIGFICTLVVCTSVAACAGHFRAAPRPAPQAYIKCDCADDTEVPLIVAGKRLSF